MEDLGMNSAMVNLNNSMTKAGWFYHLVTERCSPWTKYLQYKDTKPQMSAFLKSLRHI